MNDEPDDPPEFEPEPTDSQPELSPYELREKLDAIPYVILENGKITRCNDFERFARFLSDPDARRIDRTTICEAKPHPSRGPWSYQHETEECPDFTHIHHCFVSTVFLTTMMVFDGQKLFETMLFGGPFEEYRSQSDTPAEAKKDHWEMVDFARRVENWCSRRGNGKRSRKHYKRLRRLIRLADKRSPMWIFRQYFRELRFWKRVYRTPVAEKMPNILFRYFVHVRVLRASKSAEDKRMLDRVSEFLPRELIEQFAEE